MRKITTLSATALAAVSFAGTAHADDVIWDGYGSFAAGYHSLAERSGSYADYQNGALTGSGVIANPGKLDGLDINARISVSIPLGGHYGAQVDGEFDHIVTSFPSSYNEPAYKSDGNTVAVHAYSRDSSKGLIGLFGQRNGASSNYGYYGSNTTYAIGGEAQAYVGNLTLYGQVAYAAGDHVSNYGYLGGGVGSGPAFNLQARYFPTPNWALTLKTGYQFAASHYNYSGTGYSENYRTTYSGLLFGARSEYRLTNSRASLFLDGQFRTILAKSTDGGTETDESTYSYVDYSRANLHDFRLLVGVKLNFGAHTLFERDRSGASLDPITPMFDGITTLVGGEAS